MDVFKNNRKKYKEGLTDRTNIIVNEVKNAIFKPNNHNQGDVDNKKDANKNTKNIKQVIF